MTRAARRIVGVVTAATGVLLVAGVLLWRSAGRSAPGAEISPPPDAETLVGKREAAALRALEIERRKGRSDSQAVAPREGLPSAPSLPTERKPSHIKRPTTAVPPSPAKPEEVAARSKLAPAVEHHPGTELMFVNCDQLPCRARLQARDLDTVLAAAREASSTYQGHLGVKLHEHYETFMGRYFRAELDVDTKDPQSVPVGIEPYP